MYSIQVRIRFRAGHRLLNYNGKCNRLHGEGYTAILIFETERLDEKGMVLDFSEIKNKIKSWIDENWDHAVILNQNDELVKILREHKQKVFVLPFNPTAENMAYFLYRVVGKWYPEMIKKVGIIESWNDSIAWYEE